MDLKALEKANSIKKKIRDIEDFIEGVERVWTGRLIQKERKFFIGRKPYGMLDSTELHLEGKLRNKMLDVLREEVKQLKEEFEAI